MIGLILLACVAIAQGQFIQPKIVDFESLFGNSAQQPQVRVPPTPIETSNNVQVQPQPRPQITQTQAQTRPQPQPVNPQTQPQPAPVVLPALTQSPPIIPNPQPKTNQPLSKPALSALAGLTGLPETLTGINKQFGGGAVPTNTGFGQGIPTGPNFNTGLFGFPRSSTGFGNPGFGNSGFGNSGFGNSGFGNPGFGAPQISNLGPIPGGPFPGNLGGSAPGAGLFGDLGGLGAALGQSLGLSDILKQTGIVPNGNAQIGALGQPPSNVVGLPGVGGLDIMGLVSSLGKRAFNGTNVTEALPPNKLNSFADDFTNQIVPNLTDVNLSKYMGRWFEGINSPKASNQRCIVHHYGGLTTNGKTSTFTSLKIYRQGSEFGNVQYSIGYAFRAGRGDGMLQMHSSESSQPVPYWIYHVGPIGKDDHGNEQYEYAVVSNWIRYPVMVLVRNPDKFMKEYYVDVLRWLEDNDFITDFSRAFNLIQPVDYTNCQYSDATFAQFGRKV